LIISPAPLATKPWRFDPDSIPFDGDLLERGHIADKLTGFVNRLQAGAVLSIDAPWGEGKTWFGNHWSAKLREGGHKVVFVNAFEQDYIEDPFMLIAAELATLLDDKKGAAEKLRVTAAAVMKALLPIGTKALINAAGRLALGTADLSGGFEKALEAAQDRAGETAEKWVEKRLEDHAHEKNSVDDYKDALIEFAEKEDKPVVVFIDELDRCNPAFAVRLIERIKHFFEIENLVFVLLMNREQLENAIKGIYGADTDAAAYLGKFVHLFFRLPSNATNRFVPNALLRFGFGPSSPDADLVDSFSHHLEIWVKRANLSLRDVERACALFALATDRESGGLLAYLITLRLKKPKLYAGLLKKSPEAYKESIVWLNSFMAPVKAGQAAPTATTSPNFYTGCLMELHTSAQHHPNPVHMPYLDIHERGVIGSAENRFRHRAIEMVLKQIDLSLEV